jgi:SAM-dependent methyltransferase
MRKDVENLGKVYAAALAAKGLSPAGVLWPNAADLAARFEVLLGPIDFTRYSSVARVRILDLGCGPGFLPDYLAENDLLDSVEYTGVDIFKATISHAQHRWPGYHFELRDVRDRPFTADAFDFCVICGAFTGRFNTSYKDMEAMVRDTLTAIWPSVRIGMSFNVMSKHVDWERDDLFHWPLDDIMAFCKGKLSRHVSLRLDYGLWETSATVMRAPSPQRGAVPQRWLAEAP